MQSKATTPDAYLDELPEDRRQALMTLRTLIRQTAPDAVEGMRYGMISYDLGEMLCALASQKGYMALYVGTDALEHHRDRLGKLNVGKGCIRFKRLADLSLDVVSDILRESAGQRMC